VRATEKSQRRRGIALEGAILDAAWAELDERGYDDFTLEGVAKRAGTSRPVLNRRWPSRRELAAAAMARNVAQNPIAVPDFGNVGDEISWLLRQLSDRGRPDLLRVFFDMVPDLAIAHSNLAELKAEIADRNLARHPVHEILERGVARGEVDPNRITPRVVALPTDLMRHEMMMTFAPITDDAIREIVQQVYLPLVTRWSDGA
jgi:AcrR family transcriptional regulator